jgi:hypothetical protein
MAVNRHQSIWRLTGQYGVSETDFGEHPPQRICIHEVFKQIQKIEEFSMLVSSWKDKSNEETNCRFGLRILLNDRDHFNGLREAEIEIGGQTYLFSLKPRFWTTCPELRDEDVGADTTPIRDWLKRHGKLVWETGKPAKYDLIPLGNGRFKLR